MKMGFGCIWGEGKALFLFVCGFFVLFYFKRKHYGKAMAPLVTAFLILRTKHILSICRIFIPYSRLEDK